MLKDQFASTFTGGQDIKSIDRGSPARTAASAKWRTLCWVGALALAAFAATKSPATALAQETGNFCAEDGPAGAVTCTAADGGISRFNWISISDPCTNTTGDMATLTFEIDITTGSPQRYDYGFFIDLTGAVNGARDGDSCYHDYLPAPLSTSNTPPGPPYLNISPDNDACGDADSNQTWTRTTQAVTITCADNNNNGFYDVSVCNSYNNNTNGTCNSVSDAYPQNSAKCQCFLFDVTTPTAVKLAGLSATSGGLGTNGPLLATLLGVVGAAAVLAGRRRVRSSGT